MSNKFELTLADGTSKEYSRKIDATKAADRAEQGYRLTSPKGEILVDTIAEAQAAAAAKPAATKAAKDAKPAAVKTPKRTRTVVGTFDTTGKETHKCEGACGEVLSVKKFPTTGTDGARAVECRIDRDKRTKAEKAARAAAKAS